MDSGSFALDQFGKGEIEGKLDQFGKKQKKMRGKLRKTLQLNSSFDLLQHGFDSALSLDLLPHGYQLVKLHGSTSLGTAILAAKTFGLAIPFDTSKYVEVFYTRNK